MEKAHLFGVSHLAEGKHLAPLINTSMKKRRQRRRRMMEKAHLFGVSHLAKGKRLAPLINTSMKGRRLESGVGAWHRIA